jgi:hypothetical protein
VNIVTSICSLSGRLITEVIAIAHDSYDDRAWSRKGYNHKKDLAFPIALAQNPFDILTMALLTYDLAFDYTTINILYGYSTLTHTLKSMFTYDVFRVFDCLAKENDPFRHYFALHNII